MNNIVAQDNEQSKKHKPTFERSKAKETQAKCLQDIIPSKISCAEAQRKTGTDKANISRAVKGKTLLNAKAFSIIMKEGLKLRSVNEIKSHIYDCLELDKFLEIELGKEYEDPNFESELISTSLNQAITDKTSREIYGLLYALKKIDINILLNLYSKDEVNEKLFTFTKYNIATLHKTLGILEFNDKMISSNFTHNKTQLEIIASGITEKSMKESRTIYGQDIVLLNKKNTRKLQSKMNELNSELSEFVKELEEAEKAEHNTEKELSNYSLVFHKSKTITYSSSQNEVVQ